MSAGWHPDPFGRYPQRYHDGSAWTEHVSSAAGTTMTDPAGATPATAGHGTLLAAPPGSAGSLPQGVTYASPWVRLGSYVLESVLMVITLGIGWLIWALTTAGDGQTPAKRLLNLRVIRDSDHRPAGLGLMFWMRGILAGLVVGFVWIFTLGIIFLMPFWDRRNQNMWDKISSTYVVLDPADAWGTRA